MKHIPNHGTRVHGLLDRSGSYSQYTMILNHALIEGLHMAHTFNTSRYSLTNYISASTDLTRQMYDRKEIIITKSEYIDS